MWQAVYRTGVVPEVEVVQAARRRVGHRAVHLLDVVGEHALGPRHQFVLHDRASPLTPPSLQGVNGPSEHAVTTAYNFGVDGKFQQPQPPAQGLSQGQDLNTDIKAKL